MSTGVRPIGPPPLAAATVTAGPLSAGVPPPRPILGDPIAAAGPQVRDKLYIDRIEAMMMDNASLQRRLNGVSTDLDELRRDREDLINNLKRLETDNDRVNRIAN